MGLPIRSRAPPRPRTFHFNTRRSRARIQRSEALLYAIGINAPNTIGQDALIDAAALHTLTDRTGGFTEVVDGEGALVPVAERIAEELRQQYLIGFTPTTLDGKFHRVKVQLNGCPGLPGRIRRARNDFFFSVASVSSLPSFRSLLRSLRPLRRLASQGHQLRLDQPPPPLSRTPFAGFGAMQTLTVPLRVLGFVVATRAALAAGLGLLLADRLSARQRRTIGVALVGFGAVTTIPAARWLSRGIRRVPSIPAASSDARLIGTTRYPRKGDDAL